MPRMTDDQLAREAARWESLRAVPADWRPDPGAVPRVGLAVTRWRCGNGHEWVEKPNWFMPRVSFDFGDDRGDFCMRCMLDFMRRHGMAAEQLPDADQPVAVPREG